MRIKATQSFVHVKFGPLTRGEVREMDEDAAEDLIRAGFAVQDDAVPETEAPTRTADAGPERTPEKRKRGNRGE